jgi:hypothetical protein
MATTVELFGRVRAGSDRGGGRQREGRPALPRRVAPFVQSAFAHAHGAARSRSVAFNRDLPIAVRRESLCRIGFEQLGIVCPGAAGLLARSVLAPLEKPEVPA